MTDPVAIARAIVDGNVYMTLGTADADGRPWATPVYFSESAYEHYYWISSPEARHSRNIAVRPEVGIVIFDSRIPVGTGQAVYIEAAAEELAGDDVEAGLEVYPGPPERGARRIAIEDVVPPGSFRLYRATAAQHWILDPAGARDVRVPVTLSR
jgi:Pyridoxamine 5'-phosphate oxidase